MFVVLHCLQLSIHGEHESGFGSHSAFQDPLCLRARTISVFKIPYNNSLADQTEKSLVYGTLGDGLDSKRKWRSFYNFTS